MSNGFEAQYKILAEIKLVEEKISRLNRDKERIPKELEKIESEFQTAKATRDEGKQRLDNFTKRLRDAELELKTKEAALAKAQEKMMEVKTNAEYQAALKENEGQVQEKSRLEDEILTLMTDLETEKSQMVNVEKTFKSVEDKIKTSKKELEEEATLIEKALKEQIEKRNAIAAQFEPEIGSMYKLVSSRLQGIPVVAVQNGQCLGCHVKMPPQLYNEILGFRLVHRCPRCGKILIIANSDTTENTETAAQ